MSEKLQVYECGEYYWMLASSVPEAYQEYQAHMIEHTGHRDNDLNMADVRVLDEAEMKRLKYWPNDADDGELTYWQQYEMEMRDDPFKTRVFAVCE